MKKVRGLFLSSIALGFAFVLAVSDARAEKSDIVDQALQSQQIRLSDAATLYDKLAALFDAVKGSKPSQAEITGLLAGRIVFSGGPDYNPAQDPIIVYGSVLCGSVVDNAAEEGPLAQSSFKIYPYQFDPGYSAGEVDHMNSIDISNIEGDFRWKAAHGLTVPDFNNPTGITFQLYGKVWHGKGTDDQQFQEKDLYELRKSGDLIILRYDKNVAVGRGSGYAYYYKNVYPGLPRTR